MFSREANESCCIMALACQRDSYLRELTTTVKSCTAATLVTTQNGKKKLQGYEIILEDTVLFPEGGGQPDDRGTIADAQVLRVTRRGAEAVHFVTSPLEPGSEVKVKVDWKRRWDHMQQHSGQHLVTSLATAMFGYQTTCWNLGEKTSYIELDTTTLPADEIESLEEAVNAKIREGVSMYPTLYENKDDPRLKEVRSRGLPDDHVGPVRVVTIENIDTDMCCGTHVSSLAHLQAVKLLGLDKGHKGSVQLVFVIGERVLQSMARYVQNEKGMTALLKGHPDQHVELVDKLQKAFKVANKNSQTLLRDVALMEALKFKQNKKPLLILHRKEGDNEFMNILVNELADPSVLVLVTVGDDKGAGMFLLAGPEQTVSTLGPRVSETLDGKGGGKKGRYQGKANRLNKLPQVEKILQEYVQEQKP